jgi:hypothetical protein
MKSNLCVVCTFYIVSKKALLNPKFEEIIPVFLEEFCFYSFINMCIHCLCRFLPPVKSCVAPVLTVRSNFKPVFVGCEIRVQLHMWISRCFFLSCWKSCSFLIELLGKWALLMLLSFLAILIYILITLCHLMSIHGTVFCQWVLW